MKNCIWKGLCWFFILLTLLLTFSPVVFAQSGHGGSTEVIAHVEPQSTAPVTETQPLSTLPTAQPVPADSQPVQTGEMIAWFAFIILLASGILLTALRMRDGSP